FGSLQAIAELRQPFDGGFVSLEIEPSDQHLHRSVGTVLRPRSGPANPLAESNGHKNPDQAVHHNHRSALAHAVPRRHIRSVRLPPSLKLRRTAIALAKAVSRTSGRITAQSRAPGRSFGRWR